MIYKITMRNFRFLFFIIITNFCHITQVYSFNISSAPDKNIIWQDNFDNRIIKDWEIVDDVDGEKSNWFIEKGYLIHNTDYGDTKKLLGTNIINGNAEWDNYILRTNIVCTDDDYIGILFRYKDINNYYRLLISCQRKIISLEKRVDGEFQSLAEYTKKEWPYVKFSATIALNGNNIKVYLNNNLFFDINDSQFNKGKVGFTSISNLGSFFDDITIYSKYDILPVEVKQAIIRGPYLQNVLGDHAVIMWDTSLPANSVVEYGLTQNTEWSLENDKEVSKHEVMLKNLESETVYYYRVRSNGITGDWYSFKTAAKTATPFSFIAYGDTQMNFLRHSEIIEQFKKHNFDFVLNCGDVVQRGPRDDWDLEFFDPLKNVLTEKPIYAAIGNHELNSENFYKNFSNPNVEHENFYSFQYGNCFFVFIDNPRVAYPDKDYYTDYTPGSEQYIWLEKELSSDKAQKAEWLIAVSHVPSYVAGSQDNFEGNKKYLVPLFEKYDVDISFSGHVHGYERGEVNGVNYIITAGGGGAQNKRKASEPKLYKDFKLVYNFCCIEINNNVLSFTAYDNSNKIIDEFEIKH